MKSTGEECYIFYFVQGDSCEIQYLENISKIAFIKFQK